MAWVGAEHCLKGRQPQQAGCTDVHHMIPKVWIMVGELLASISQRMCCEVLMHNCQSILCRLGFAAIHDGFHYLTRSQISLTSAFCCIGALPVHCLSVIP